MNLLPVLLVFFILFALLLLAYHVTSEYQTGIKARLNAIRDMPLEDEESEPLNLPFRLRVLRPIKVKLINYFNRLLPANFKSVIEQKLAQCGTPGGLKAGTFMTGVLVISFTLTVIGFFVPLIIGAGFNNAVLIALASFLISILIPLMWLVTTADRRLTQVDRALPDAIDLLVVSVEAGLGFDMAMTKLTEKMKNPLGEEFYRALSEINMGKPRQAALRDIAKRTGSANLNSFLAVVIQATQMGLSMGKILRIQSDTMRLARRQKAEEQAMKAPVKILFPLLLFIFPSIFVIILGPAVIKIFKVL